MLGCLKNLPLQESEDWVIWNRYQNGPRIVVDLMIEKKTTRLRMSLRSSRWVEFLRISPSKAQLMPFWYWVSTQT